MKQLLTAFLLLFSFTLFAQEEGLSLLNHYRYYADDANALYKEMVEEAETRFAACEARIASLSTAQDWEEYRQQVKLKLAQIIGPFPEKTPLKPEIMGVIEQDDYTIEKLIYESQPGFYVTAALFLPKKRKEKAPAILTSVFAATLIRPKSSTWSRKGLLCWPLIRWGRGSVCSIPMKKENGHVSVALPTSIAMPGRRVLSMAVRWPKP